MATTQQPKITAISTSSLQDPENLRHHHQQHHQDDDKNCGSEFQESGWSNLSPQSTEDGPHFSGEKMSYGSEESGGIHEVLVREGEEKFEWTPYAELHLLNSLRGLRPVGANFHFYINVVHERFNKAMAIDLPRAELIKKLNSYYNFEEALKICGDDVPNNVSEFSLNDEFPKFVELKRAARAKRAAAHQMDRSGDGSGK